MERSDLFRTCNYILNYKDNTILTPQVEHQIVNDAFILAEELLFRLKREEILAADDYPVARNNGAAMI